MATRGERNNNPGNINKEITPFKGEIPGDDSRFCSFSSPVFGIRAIAVVLLTYYHKHNLRTVQGIINRWAPSSENDSDSYVADVAKRVGVDPEEEIEVDHPDTLEKLVSAIIFHENGEIIYSDQQIEDGVDAALS